jgi:hypothetical protein
MCRENRLAQLNARKAAKSGDPRTVVHHHPGVCLRKTPAPRPDVAGPKADWEVCFGVRLSVWSSAQLLRHEFGKQRGRTPGEYALKALRLGTSMGRRIHN